jgi:hypothetical protein
MTDAIQSTGFFERDESWITEQVESTQSHDIIVHFPVVTLLAFLGIIQFEQSVTIAPLVDLSRHSSIHRREDKEIAIIPFLRMDFMISLKVVKISSMLTLKTSKVPNHSRFSGVDFCFTKDISRIYKEMFPFRSFSTGFIWLYAKKCFHVPDLSIGINPMKSKSETEFLILKRFCSPIPQSDMTMKIGLIICANPFEPSMEFHRLRSFKDIEKWWFVATREEMK